jgi:hypothetical protein
MTAFVANTNLLELIGLKSAVEGTYINNASVEVTIKNQQGDPIEGLSGFAWPLTMDYVTGSDGNYRVALPDGLAFLNKKKCIAFIEVDAGVDRIGHWEFPFTPITRTGVDDGNS